MSRFRWLLLPCLGLALVRAAPAQNGAPRSDFQTVMQTGSPYDAKSHVATDVALVAADESLGAVAGAAAKVRTWRDHGYRVYGFAALARVYEDYMRGGWRDLAGNVDAGAHEGEIQQDRYGNHFGPHRYMMEPSLRLMEHKKLWAKAMIDAGTEGMGFEEPDLFTDGGYSPQFQREWRDYYHQPWEAPHSSLDARVKSERLKSFLSYRAYKTLSEYCKQQGGPGFRFILPTHSLPGYMLPGVTTGYFQTLALPSVDVLQAQVWTGTARVPVLWEGELRQKLFENAYVDYSYSANLAEALGKEVWLNLDPYEDDPGLTFDLYKAGFENTLAASLMFPGATRWEILPWPNRIYGNDRIPPPYGTEIQNVVRAMTEIGGARSHAWHTRSPRVGVLISETAMWETRDPQPSNPQSLFALTLPLLSLGVPVDAVPLEAVTVRRYLDRFRVLFLSYDSFKPLSPAVHSALARWVREKGGTLVLLGGRSAYNEAHLWWRDAGFDSPTAHLLAELGLGGKTQRLVPQRPADIRPAPGGDSTGYAAAVAGLWTGQHGSDHVARPVSFTPDGGAAEERYLDTVLPPGFARKELRFADATGYFTYRFRAKGLAGLHVRADLANSYAAEASVDGSHWTTLIASPPDVHDGSNRREVDLDLAPYLSGASVWLRFRDPSPADGWGPSLRRVTLLPTYRPGYQPPTEEPPLAQRDTYCAAYHGLTNPGRALVQGAAGAPIAFAVSVGSGEVIGIGAPPALFGASAENGRRLRQLLTAICRKKHLPLEGDGVLRLQRGPYEVVFPISREVRLRGRYVDVLSPELTLLTDPKFPVGTPHLLRSVESALHSKRPGLLFASHKLSNLRERPDGLELTLEGPERIPAACRLWPGTNNPTKVECRRLRDGFVLTAEIRRDPDGTIYVRVPNQEGGVRVTFNATH